MQTNATTADVSLCSVGEELQEAAIPLQLVSGWLDSTAAATINLYHHCGQAPGLFWSCMCGSSVRFECHRHSTAGPNKGIV